MAGTEQAKTPTARATTSRFRAAISRLVAPQSQVLAEQEQERAAELGGTLVADLESRRDATVCGTLRSVTLRPRAGVPALEAALYDGSGTLTTGERTLEIPGRPVVLSYLAGASGGGWDVVNRKVMALWPITNSDNVLRINLQAAAIDAVWE